MSLGIHDFDFELPERLIAQQPALEITPNCWCMTVQLNVFKIATFTN
jgi:S-adenosylmethionine:tRNA-ribosyltransferase-isomerase (queuine synthetase)